MTTAKSRVEKVESALHPREAVLAWLAEVQDLRHISDYSYHVAAAHIDDAPMSVIGRRVRARVREDMKGKPRNDIDDALYRAFGDALFLFCLVFQVNIDAVQVARLEQLRATAAFFWMGCLLSGPRDEEVAPEELETYHRETAEAWRLWYSAIGSIRDRVDRANRVRAVLVERYYGGHEILFADARSDWADYEELIERIGRIADGIAETTWGAIARDEAAHKKPDRPMEAVNDAEVQAFIDAARVRAYEVLGERPKAVAIMERQILNGQTTLGSY